MRPRALIIALLIVPALGAPARAYVPERTPHRDAEASARRMLATPQARGTLPGVIVMRGGRTLFSLNAARALQPASLLKLLTTTAALVRFGPEHRFATRVLATRRAATVSRLYLAGGGDPTLATEAYRRARFEPKPSDRIKQPAFPRGSPTIEQLAARVAATGVRVVAGDLVADESLFDSERTQAGWLSRYLGRDPDTGYLTALPVNEARADLEGKTLLPAGPLPAGQALRKALAARGVTVRGNVVAGKTPGGVVELARVESPTLAEMVGFIDRYSINFHAELLLKQLGARFGGAGTTAAGAGVVRRTLTAMRIPVAGLRMADGSGLSLLNRVTPATIAALLQRILVTDGPAWDAMRASLPVAGGAGTLEKRMRRAPAGGNLRGKTGQIMHVRALAGWVTGRDGVPLVYVAIFNQAPRPLALGAPLDLFGSLLAGYPTA